MEWKYKQFEELTISELYNLLKERTKVFVLEQNCPYLDIDGKDPFSYHIFKEKEGEIIAYARVVPAGILHQEVSIGRVFVKKEYRGQGIAEGLLKQVLQYIHHDLKEVMVKIQAQEYLEKFYSSLGFQTISEVYLEDNIPHIDMMLRDMSFFRD